jgi:hypothetical protein
MILTAVGILLLFLSGYSTIQESKVLHTEIIIQIVASILLCIIDVVLSNSLYLIKVPLEKNTFKQAHSLRIASHRGQYYFK